MPRWKTNDIVNSLLDGSSDMWKVETTPPGGGVDTNGIIIHVTDSSEPDEYDRRLFVCGFTPGMYIEDGGLNPDDVEVTHVEVTDGRDSRGGLNSSCKKMIDAYHEICKRLRSQGFQVVNQLRDYF